ncbi:MAG: class I SAM-dependent methyltransferase [Planctomycetaceae bacterium]|nr:class I SAM-dependent methyltransferase [Planctomycetaceae bacterium]
MKDVAEYNRRAWDARVAKGNRWTVPVTPEVITAAREGNWEVLLTPQKPVPRSWFPELRGLDLLGLAAGGGQQAPVFAAAGANVTVLDNSPRQLNQDQMVAEREGLQITTILGDMRDLSGFTAESFDLVFNPCSVLFIPEVQSVFDEAWRVLRPGGLLMCGFVNPVRYVFDEKDLAQGHLTVRHALPYADSMHLNPEEQKKMQAEAEPFVFSHSLEELFGGQLRSGFALRDLYEDKSINDLLADYFPVFIATLSQKMHS